MKNLYDAILAARTAAEVQNKEGYDAVCLEVMSDKTFHIGRQCYRNTSFSGISMPGPISMYITVAHDSTFNSLVSFSLLEFCSHFNIPISDHVFTDFFGKQI